MKVWDWDTVNKIWNQRGLAILPETDDLDLNYVAEVSIDDDGNTITVSTFIGDGYKGYTRVFDWNGSAWVQRGEKIVGKDGDWLGRTAQLSSDGNTVVVSAYRNSDLFDNQGAIRVFDWNGSAWVKRGSDIYGQEENEFLGGYHGAVDIDDARDTIAIGSAYYNSYNGRLRIFDWNGSVWVQRGSNIDGGGVGYHTTLSNDGNTVSSGSVSDSNSSRSVIARVYDWDNENNDWVQRGSNVMEISRETDSYSSIFSSLSGNGKTISVGIPYTDNNDLVDTGEVRVYDWK